MNHYAELSWTIEDVKCIWPEATDEQAEEFLANNEGRLRDRLTELGWDILSELLPTKR